MYVFKCVRMIYKVEACNKYAETNTALMWLTALCMSVLVIHVPILLIFIWLRMKSPSLLRRSKSRTVRDSNPSRGKLYFLFVFCKIVPTGSWCPQAPVQLVAGFVSRGKNCWGVTVTTHIHSAQRLRMSGALRLLPLSL